MISKKLKEYHLENIVVDPVMVATSGSRLISETAIDTLKTQLLPMATVITPNIPEAEVLQKWRLDQKMIWWKQQRRFMKCITVQSYAKADTA